VPEFDQDRIATALEQERSTVLHQLHELGAGASGDLTGEIDYGDGFADAGAATAERTETIGMVESLTQRLGEVDAAKTKLAEGTFGVCSSCGQDIEADRLEHRPTSIKCVSCKSQNR